MTEETQAPAAEAPKKVKKPTDAEFSALRRVGAILNNLSDGAKKRVLSYYVDRAVAL